MEFFIALPLFEKIALLFFVIFLCFIFIKPLYDIFNNSN